MVLQKLFPTRLVRGGSLRRWANIKKELIPKKIFKDYAFAEPVTLFDFRRSDDEADALSRPRTSSHNWRLGDDETIGGFSRGMYNLITCTDDLTREEKLPLEGILDRDDGSSNDDNAVAATTASSPINGGTTDSSSFTPFLRWRGTLSTKIPAHQNNPQERNVIKSGYCYIRTPEFKYGSGQFSNDYNALEVTCRTDGREYAVNLQVNSYFPDDLYRMYIQAPPPEVRERLETRGGFMTVILPFRDFVLTKVGQEREMQRVLDGAINLEHVGFMLADGVDGDFEFDLARIRIVNYVSGPNGGIVGSHGAKETVEDTESLDFRRRRGW